MSYAVRNLGMAQTTLPLRCIGSRASPLHRCAGVTKVMAGRAAQDTNSWRPRSLTALSYYRFRTYLLLILALVLSDLQFSLNQH